LDQIEKDTDRDYYLAAGEAKEYGLIDNILVKRTAETKKEK
jgi:ATP-dependent Clp protease protease subunit